jgi:hypothetical protein
VCVYDAKHHIHSPTYSPFHRDQQGVKNPPPKTPCPLHHILFRKVLGEIIVCSAGQGFCVCEGVGLERAFVLDAKRSSTS